MKTLNLDKTEKTTSLLDCSISCHGLEFNGSLENFAVSCSVLLLLTFSCTALKRSSFERVLVNMPKKLYWINPGKV
jgi:hypothetical protein